MGFFRKIIDSEYKELKRFEKIANKIDALSDEMEALSDEELKAKTLEFIPTCPIDVLMDQKYYMEQYINTLRVRAEIEGIELNIVVA